MAINLKKGKTVKSSKKKLTLLAVSKNDDRELYEFSKQQEFLPFMLEFMLKIGFDKDNIHIVYFFGVSQEENEPPSLVGEEYLENPWNCEYLEIGSFKESLQTISNDYFDIEIIFFSSKIYLVIRKKIKSKINPGHILSENVLFKGEQ